jgi:hypothetical protein
MQVFLKIKMHPRSYCSVDDDIHFCAGTLDPLPASLTSDSFQIEGLVTSLLGAKGSLSPPPMSSIAKHRYSTTADSARVLAYPVRQPWKSCARSGDDKRCSALFCARRLSAQLHMHSALTEWSRFLASYLQRQRHTTHIIRSAVIWAAMQTQTGNPWDLQPLCNHFVTTDITLIDACCQELET